jgi:hypothetical protein
MDEAHTVVFMGTSNSVGFTFGVLQMAINNSKKTIYLTRII